MRCGSHGHGAGPASTTSRTPDTSRNPSRRTSDTESKTDHRADYTVRQREGPYLPWYPCRRGATPRAAAFCIEAHKGAAQSTEALGGTLLPPASGGDSRTRG